VHALGDDALRSVVPLSPGVPLPLIRGCHDLAGAPVIRRVRQFDGRVCVEPEPNPANARLPGSNGHRIGNFRCDSRIATRRIGATAEHERPDCREYPSRPPPEHAHAPILLSWPVRRQPLRTMPPGRPRAVPRRCGSRRFPASDLRERSTTQVPVSYLVESFGHRQLCSSTNAFI
jgi:hypothetical protein